MKIQIISKTRKYFDNIEIKSSLFDHFDKFSGYDLNIIDFSNQYIWQDSSNIEGCLSIRKDLLSIQQNIKQLDSSSVLFVLPLNIQLRYNVVSRWSDYTESFLLKDKINYLITELNIALGSKILLPDDILYGRTNTTINEIGFISDFSFSNRFQSFNEVQCKTATSINIMDSLYLTSLDIFENEDKARAYIDCFVGKLVFKDKPQWLDNVLFLDEKTIRDEINIKEKEIQNLKNQLDKISHYKSIVYTTGKDLVRVVFEMLGDMLGYDFSRFEDKFKEDFLIEFPDIDIVGEIKGINKNLSNKIIAQVEVNRSEHKEKLEKQGLNKKTKSMIVINTLRSLEPEGREPIHSVQEEYAKKQNCLVITTPVLLKLYEQFKNGKVLKADILHLIVDQTGVYRL